MHTHSTIRVLCKPITNCNNGAGRRREGCTSKMFGVAWQTSIKTIEPTAVEIFKAILNRKIIKESLALNTLHRNSSESMIRYYSEKHLQISMHKQIFLLPSPYIWHNNKPEVMKNQLLCSFWFLLRFLFAIFFCNPLEYKKFTIVRLLPYFKF